MVFEFHSFFNPFVKIGKKIKEINWIRIEISVSYLKKLATVNVSSLISINCPHNSIILRMIGVRQRLIETSISALSSDNDSNIQLPYSSKIFARKTKNAVVEMKTESSDNKKNRFLALNG